MKSKILEIKVTELINVETLGNKLKEQNVNVDIKYVLAFTSQIIYNSIKKKTTFNISYSNLKSLYGSVRMTIIRKFLTDNGVIEFNNSSYNLTENYKSPRYAILKLEYPEKFQNKFYSIQNSGNLPTENQINKPIDSLSDYVKRDLLAEIIEITEKRHQEQLALAQTQISELKSITALLQVEIESIRAPQSRGNPVCDPEVALMELEKDVDFKNKLPVLPKMLLDTVCDSEEDDEPINYSRVKKKTRKQKESVISNKLTEPTSTPTTIPVGRVKMKYHLISKTKFMATEYIPKADEDGLIQLIKERKGKNLPFSEYQKYKRTNILEFEELENTLLKATDSKCVLDDSLIQECVDILLLSKKKRKTLATRSVTDTISHDGNTIMYEEDVDEVKVLISPLEALKKEPEDLTDKELKLYANALFDYYLEIFGSISRMKPETEKLYASVLSEFSLREMRIIFQHIKRSWSSDYIDNLTPDTFTIDKVIEYSQRAKEIQVSVVTKESKHARVYNDQIRFLYEAMGGIKPTDKRQLAYINLVKRIGKHPTAIKKKPFDYKSFEIMLNTIGGVNSTYQGVVTTLLNSDEIRYTSDILNRIIVLSKRIK